MKKRKIKLFASIASLAMVVAVMAVGVWAATQATVGVTTNAKFVATAIEGSITASNGTEITGLVAANSTGSDTVTFVASDANNASKTITMKVNLNATGLDINTNGVIDESETIKVKYTISNTSLTTNMTVYLTVGTDTIVVDGDTDVTAKVVIPQSGWTLSTTTGHTTQYEWTVNAAANASTPTTQDIIVEYSIVGHAGQSFDTNATLPTLTFNLVSTLAEQQA